MARYSYPYQKIVDLKKSEKTQAEWILSAAIGKLQTEEMSLGQLNEEKAAWLTKLQAVSYQAISLSELQLIQNYLDFLETCITKKYIDVKQAQTEVEHKQVRLSHKVMDEKVWLKAKEHACNRFIQGMQIKEQNELDEMATVRFMLPVQ
jgi:flagellar FliJ protein